MAVLGFIPAHAGNTALPGPHLPSRRAHPRSCGEHGTPFSVSQAAFGSSPLARGTRTEECIVGLNVGFTPARAGTTSTTCLPQSHRWAHPRSRGEHFWNSSTQRPGFGSSPLARGTSPLRLLLLRPRRLIPARAGNIAHTAGYALLGPAHPRSRGEHISAFRTHSSPAGSSPLARGTYESSRG